MTKNEKKKTWSVLHKGSISLKEGIIFIFRYIYIMKKPAVIKHLKIKQITYNKNQNCSFHSGSMASILEIILLTYSC